MNTIIQNNFRFVFVRLEFKNHKVKDMTFFVNVACKAQQFYFLFVAAYFYSCYYFCFSSDLYNYLCVAINDGDRDISEIIV